MRLKNSMYNSITAIIASVINMVIGIVLNKIFIVSLGPEYLGLNGLFTNVITMLSIVELEIGTAIIFSLYKPIANKKIEEIKSLMRFYKKSYSFIGGVVAILGILLIPFLRFLVKDYSLDVNMYIVYLLFLLETVVSYFYTYKRSLIYANQKNYIVNIIHIGYLVLMNSFLALFLLKTKNYYIYLLIKISMRILENIAISIVADKMYPYLKEKNVSKLEKTVFNDIVKKIKALFFHKIAGFLVNGTDNILISSFFGLKDVGLFTNYSLILNSCSMLVGQIFTSLTASVGNLLVVENNKTTYKTFKRIQFINFILAIIVSMGILIVSKPFITVWLGNKYIMSDIIVVILVIKYYYTQTRASCSVFKEAAGICYEDRFIPMIEAVVNMVASIVLLKFFGIAGIFLGTIISTMILHLYSYPKYVFKKIFDRPYKEYYFKFIEQTIIFLLIGGITYIVGEIVIIENIWLNFVMHALLALIIPTLFIISIYYKTEEFNYFKELLFNSTNKILRKNIEFGNKKI